MNFPSGIIIFCLFLLKSKTNAHEVNKGNAFEHIWSGPPVMDTYNDYEEMQRYISTKRNIDAIKNPAMDSYITAYNIYHENCQIKHEKDKQDKIKKIVKRSAPSLPEFIKFELSDAKEPDEATKEYFRRQQKNLEFSTQNPGHQQKHHHEFEESENITEEADKESPSPHETRKVPVYRLMDHRKIKKSIKNFPEDIQNAINRVVLENKHGNYPRHIIPGYNGKLRFGDKLHKHEPNPGKYPAILFNEINLRAEQFLNKHKYTPEQDVFYHAAPQPYVSAYVAAPAEELQPVVAAHFRAPAPEIDPGHPVHPGAAAAQPVQVVPAVPEIHYVIKEVPAHALSPSEAASQQQQQQHLSGPITTQNKIAHHGYEYVADDVPIRALPLEQQQHHHHHHHHHEQQVSYVANLEKQVIKEHNPYPNSEQQLTQNVQRPANLKPLHVADDSEYNALSSLIGKSPADQIQGLTYLIAKENAQQGQQPKRPQDNTAPILFHPERANRNRVQPMQQDDSSVKTQYNAINGIHGHYVHQNAEYKPVTEAPEKDSGEVVKERVPVVHLAPIVIPTSYKNVHYGGLSPNYEDVEHGAEELRYASRYAFGYRVRDFHTGNDFGHKQNRDIDGVTRGEYHILLPDGRIQNVVYHADESGFHADVSFETGH